MLWLVPLFAQSQVYSMAENNEHTDGLGWEYCYQEYWEHDPEDQKQELGVNF